MAWASTVPMPCRTNCRNASVSKKDRQAAATIRFVHYQFDQPDGAAGAGRGRQFHACGRSPWPPAVRRRAARAKIASDRIRRKHTPPTSSARADRWPPRPPSAAESASAAGPRGLERGQVELHDQGAVDLLVAAAKVGLLGHAVGFQARRAFHCRRRGRNRRRAAGESRRHRNLCPALAQVGLAAFQKARGHFGLGAIVSGEDQTGGARLGGNAVFVRGRPEAGMGETDRLPISGRPESGPRNRNRASQRHIAQAVRAKPAGPGQLVRDDFARSLPALADRHYGRCDTSTSWAIGAGRGCRRMAARL